VEIKVAPPPAPGSRIQELGEDLIVHFRAHRSWGVIGFLTFWLTGWTCAGVFILFMLPRANWGERAFMLLWLCPWAIGEFKAGAWLLWQLRGHEVLTVTPQDLEVRREAGPFVRTSRYDSELVQDVEAARAQADYDEEPRTDFGLKLSYDDKTVYVGEGMGEREAEWVAATVRSRIRPRARWSDKETGEA
jgi:hypothetical protein